MAGGETAVKPFEKPELAPLLGRSQTLRRVEVRDRLGASLHAHTLVDRRHESGSPVARPVDYLRRGVLQNDEGRQVGVLGPEPVGHPAAEGRTTGEDRSGVHLADAGRMVDAVGPAGADYRQLVGALRHLREPVGDPQARLPVLLPGPPRRQDGRAEFPHGRDHLAEALGDRAASQTVQRRLRVEGVEVARTTFHKEEDHAASPRTQVRASWSHGPIETSGPRRREGARRNRICRQQICQGQRPEPAPGFGEELTSGTGGMDWESFHDPVTRRTGSRWN